MAESIPWKREQDPEEWAGACHFYKEPTLAVMIMELIHSTISVPGDANTSPETPPPNRALVGIKFPHTGFGEHVKT